jgi:hypothetical protein
MDCSNAQNIAAYAVRVSLNLSSLAKEISSLPFTAQNDQVHSCLVRITRQYIVPSWRHNFAQIEFTINTAKEENSSVVTLYHHTYAMNVISISAAPQTDPSHILGDGNVSIRRNAATFENRGKWNQEQILHG